jgi:dihydropteroate synthase
LPPPKKIKMIPKSAEIKLKGHNLPVGSRTCLMGVLNVTPDSFSDGGRYLEPELAIERALKMTEEGADIIDIGGESSRPGAQRVNLEEELRRVIPIVKAVKKKCDVAISIDTYKSEVARQALSEGAEIVNDITALNGDEDMARVIAAAGAAAVLMHMKGEPGTMQVSPSYEDVIGEIMVYLSGAIAKAESSGIDPLRIIVDPGIGFGKKTDHNVTILRQLKRLRDLGKPLLVGTSRKSFIGELTARSVEERDFGTAASITAAIMNGADLIRTHDVRNTLDVIKVADAIAGIK